MKGCLIAFIVIFILGILGSAIAFFVAYYVYDQSGNTYQPVTVNETNTNSNANETGDKDKKSAVNTGDIEMVEVAGGKFIMGCNRYCKDDEIPTHQVSLKSFKIAKYELTQAQWTEIMGSNPSSFKGCDNCPVENVSWDEVQIFIKKLNDKTGSNYRLPTEAEWEYAARGGKNTSIFTYSGSDNLDEVAWHKGNSGGKTKPVGAKKANELGIYDMTGNVTEWCSDWYGPYSDENQSNPKGAVSGTGRVLRGGSWNYKGEDCRVFFRGTLTSQAKQNMRGFRLAE